MGNRRVSAPRTPADLATRPVLTVVGLISGTSADGIDAAVVRIVGSAEGVAHCATLGGLTVPFDDALRVRLLAAGAARADEVARLHALLGERFAAAALAAIDAVGLRRDEVDAIGSHGQTVAHVPRSRAAGAVGAPAGAVTLQVGCAARIAERTGLPVVSDFRSRDTAAGGEGAPLVPYADWLLLRTTAATRLALNLGGVANVTLVTPRAEDVRAFDTGPANGPLDAAARRLLGASCDRDGAAAARGTVDAAEVARVLSDPWFDTPPPRSLARETFGERLVADLLARRADLAPEDVLATLTEVVARTVERALRDHLRVGAAGVAPPCDVVVSGGGVRNVTLMARLAAVLRPLPVRSSAELGIDPDLREAVAFALLAGASLRGLPGNLPGVTGAAGPRVLGSFTLP